MLCSSGTEVLLFAQAVNEKAENTDNAIHVILMTALFIKFLFFNFSSSNYFIDIL